MDCKTREEVEVNLKHPGRYMFDAAQVLHKIGYFKSACDELTGVLWRTGAFFAFFRRTKYEHGIEPSPTARVVRSSFASRVPSLAWKLRKANPSFADYTGTGVFLVFSAYSDAPVLKPVLSVAFHEDVLGRSSEPPKSLTEKSSFWCTYLAPNSPSHFCHSQVIQTKKGHLISQQK